MLRMIHPDVYTLATTYCGYMLLWVGLPLNVTPVSVLASIGPIIIEC